MANELAFGYSGNDTLVIDEDNAQSAERALSRLRFPDDEPTTSEVHPPEPSESEPSTEEPQVTIGLNGTSAQ